jgi:hypothetical protein
VEAPTLGWHLVGVEGKVGSSGVYIYMHNG